MLDCDASSSPLRVLKHGEDGALELAGNDVRDDRSSVMRIEKNVERGWSGRSLGRRPFRSSRNMADSPCISLWIAWICLEC
jgi:hypothetical protein